MVSLLCCGKCTQSTWNARVVENLSQIKFRFGDIRLETAFLKKKRNERMNEIQKQKTERTKERKKNNIEYTHIFLFCLIPLSSEAI